jgi:hypothetical protein
MSWLNTSINQLTVPLGMLLGLFGACLGFIAQRKRRAGAVRPYISEGVRNGLIAALLICAAYSDLPSLRTSSGNKKATPEGALLFARGCFTGLFRG